MQDLLRVCHFTRCHPQASISKTLDVFRLNSGLDNCTKISPSESNSVSLTGVKLILYMKLKSSSINLFITENVSSRYKVTDLILEDKHFLFQPGTPTISTKDFHFPRSFNESAQLVSKLGHGRFRTCLFRFIIYQLCRHLNSRRTNKRTQTFSKPVYRNNYF